VAGKPKAKKGKKSALLAVTPPVTFRVEVDCRRFGDNFLNKTVVTLYLEAGTDIGGVKIPYKLTLNPDGTIRIGCQTLTLMDWLSRRGKGFAEWYCLEDEVVHIYEGVVRMLQGKLVAFAKLQREATDLFAVFTNNYLQTQRPTFEAWEAEANESIALLRRTRGKAKGGRKASKRR
jgi:hypothetical protein